MHPFHDKAQGRWLLLFWAFAIATLFFAVTPIYVIRPFRAQGARELMFALQVQHWAPVASLLLALAAVIAMAIAWRAAAPGQWVMKSGLLGGLLLVVGAAVVAHTNVYEKMFHPMGAPSLLSTAQAKLNDKDMVLGVELNGEARAYPVPQMAYHHIVNDFLGGIPLVGTY